MLIPICENLLMRMWGNSPSGADPTHRVLGNRQAIQGIFNLSRWWPYLASLVAFKESEGLERIAYGGLSCQPLTVRFRFQWPILYTRLV